jgi:quercetin dioxygenase-like cupin family protein
MERTAKTRLHKFEGGRRAIEDQQAETDDRFTWSGVPPQLYKKPSGDWTRVIRHVLIGDQGEETRFHLRYFEIASQGYTTLEKHGHAHVVIGIRGKGRVIAGAKCYDLSFLDALYIAPNTPHQLINEGGEPFGFFCLVDAERDLPQPLSEDEWEAMKSDPEIQRVLRPSLV